MLLGDFGAEVIKVEPPEGESSRRWGSARFGEAGDLSGLFLALNRNKASITVDLKSRRGQGRGRAARARRRRRARELQAGRRGPPRASATPACRRSSPTSSTASVSGFGQTGPLREQPGYDQLLQAFAGHMSITGEPGRPSVRIGPSAIDLITGAHAAFGVVLALRVRDRTGQGQHLETSLYDSSLHLISHYIADYTGSGRLPGKVGGSFAFLAPYGMYHGPRPRALRRRRHRRDVREPLRGARSARARRPTRASPPTRRASRTATSSTRRWRRCSRQPTRAHWVDTLPRARASRRASSTTSPRSSSRRRRSRAR